MGQIRSYVEGWLAQVAYSTHTPTQSAYERLAARLGVSPARITRAQLIDDNQLVLMYFAAKSVNSIRLFAPPAKISEYLDVLKMANADLYIQEGAGAPEIDDHTVIDIDWRE